MWSKLAAGQQRRWVEEVWKIGKSFVKKSTEKREWSLDLKSNVIKPETQLPKFAAPFIRSLRRLWAYPVPDSKNVFLKTAIRHISQPKSGAFLPKFRFLSSKLLQLGFVGVAIAHQGDEYFAAKAVSCEIYDLLFDGFERDVANKTDYSTFNNDDSDITIISDDGEYNGFQGLSDEIENDDFSEYSLKENNMEEVTSYDIELSNVVHHHIEETIQSNYVKVFDEVTRTQENIISLSSTVNGLLDRNEFLESEISINHTRIKELEHLLNVERERNIKLENENKHLSDEKRSLNITCVQYIKQMKEMGDIWMKSMNGMENSDKAVNMDGDHDYGERSNGFQATFRPQSSDQWKMM